MNCCRIRKRIVRESQFSSYRCGREGNKSDGGIGRVRLYALRHQPRPVIFIFFFLPLLFVEGDVAEALEEETRKQGKINKHKPFFFSLYCRW